MTLENSKQELERILSEHQRESGLHMIGGRDKLAQRLLTLFEPDAEPGPRLRSGKPMD